MLHATPSSSNPSYEALGEAAMYLLTLDLVFEHLRHGREETRVVQRVGRHWRIEGRLSPTPQLVVVPMDN